MNKDLFIKELEKIGINLTNEQILKLDQFYRILLEWNEKINLTTITDENEVYLKHFYDSLTLIKVVNFNEKMTLCDVGTGAGFPGIVLKIVFPNLRVTLIDSLNKRIIYLNDVINRLDLTDIEAVHARMEDYSRKNIEKFDIITARAVASISVLAEISVLSLKIGGNIVLMKANGEEELNGSINALKKLKLRVEKFDKFLLPIENSSRMLISIIKTSKTDKIYPRNIDKIRKMPL